MYSKLIREPGVTYVMQKLLEDSMSNRGKSNDIGRELQSPGGLTVYMSCRVHPVVCSNSKYMKGDTDVQDTFRAETGLAAKL